MHCENTACRVSQNLVQSNCAPCAEQGGGCTLPSCSASKQLTQRKVEMDSKKCSHFFFDDVADFLIPGLIPGPLLGVLLGVLLDCSGTVAGCSSTAVFGCIAWISLADLSVRTLDQNFAILVFPMQCWNFMNPGLSLGVIAGLSLV